MLKGNRTVPQLPSFFHFWGGLEQNHTSPTGRGMCGSPQPLPFVFIVLLFVGAWVGKTTKKESGSAVTIVQEIEVTPKKRKNFSQGGKQKVLLLWSTEHFFGSALLKTHLLEWWVVQLWVVLEWHSHTRSRRQCSPTLLKSTRC